jgi:hypothetical protein
MRPRFTLIVIDVSPFRVKICAGDYFLYLILTVCCIIPARHVVLVIGYAQGYGPNKAGKR